VEAHRQIGLLLPCNVVVPPDPDHAGDMLVEAMNPGHLVEVTGDAELRPVAEEVTDRVKAAIDSLKCGSPVTAGE
jgi:uncharacterized protein (DUF302 family)